MRVPLVVAGLSACVALAAFAALRAYPGAPRPVLWGALATLYLAPLPPCALASGRIVERLRRLTRGRTLRSAALASVFVGAYLPCLVDTTWVVLFRG